ncbi:MAG: NAD(P)-dependent oxidoreductase [Pseudomonadota bacterium]
MIGVAGCGRMGLPMARALRTAGFETVGFDIKPSEAFGDFAPHMRTASEFAAQTETLISVVRDTAQTDDVLFGAQGFVTGPNLKRVIISSTLSPKYVQDLRTRVPAGLTLIDAPMSGAAIAAQEARLSFMLGGEAQDIHDALPLFEAMGHSITHCGAFGAGMVVKVLNNLVAASSVAATRTALSWADELGVAEGTLLKVLHASSGQTWFGSGFDDIEFARDGLAEDNSIGILAKDVEAAMDGAPKQADLALPQALLAAIKGLTPR